MSFADLANQLKNLNENIVLIYAFNATGKTRLSVAYKDATKNPESGQHAGVYYNAFSEDLFVWDNDEDNDGTNIRLKILPSSLNRFHSFLYEDPDSVMAKLAAYFPKFTFQFNTHDDPEKGIESVTFFSSTEKENPIKISRGEERIFVWCFFLALLEVDRWANEQDAHIFIDDPVSSLDEHNIYVTADTIFEQIENHYLKKRIIITTHHIGLFSILADRLTKGEKSSRYKNLTKFFVLAESGNEPSLDNPRGNVFLYHLHLLQALEDAGHTQLYVHHVVLLRQVLENVASFLGVGRINFALEQIGVENVESTANTINSLSHKDAYYAQSDLMSPPVEVVFRDVFAKLLAKYPFVLHAG
ncbi:MAG TPA: AAA family ATPase [Lentisphaeria bacterium]|mgnify:CR=1 FL=1|nr:AAA family ATPase [Lentisphaeria bacterium]